MTAGITVFNDNGDVQINDTFKNYVFIGKGTVTLTVPIGIYDDHFTKVTFPANELVAFSAPSGSSFGVLNSPLFSGGVQTYLLSAPPGTTTITYYRFGIGSPSTVGNHLEIYDASGTLVFSDFSNYLKVLDAKAGQYTAGVSNHVIPMNNLAWATIAESYIGSSLAVIPSLSTWSIFTVSQAYVADLQMFYFQQGYVKSYFYPFIPSTQNVYIKQSYNYLVVDVTNL